MSPFSKLPPNPGNSMLIRQCLLAAPAEMYRQLFDGKLKTTQQKLHAVEMAVQSMTAIHIYRNDLYTVQMRYQDPFIHLAIQRNDGGPCMNWRDFQTIKNQLVGAEHEAIEIYPAESRLVDTANEYHLWVYADPSFRIPAGFRHRFVTSEPLQDMAMRALRSVANRPALRPPAKQPKPLPLAPATT